MIDFWITDIKEKQRKVVYGETRQQIYDHYYGLTELGLFTPYNMWTHPPVRFHEIISNISEKGCAK